MKWPSQDESQEDGIREKSLPATHPDLATSYCNIGLVYNRMGEYSKALSYYEKALGIREKSLPATHPDLVWCITTWQSIRKPWHTTKKR